MRRARWWGALAPVAWVVLLAGPAAADPAQPGDVRSEVVRLTPDVPGVEAGVVGGDSFLRLRVDDGIEVVVLGYEGEPYLRIRSDGTVEVNDRSPARWLNENRLAAVGLPPTADAAAEPTWRRIGSGGETAWHDHRTHWMAASRPDPPERDWSVPLLVDGRPATIEGRYVYSPPPPAWPWWTGALVFAAAIIPLGRRHRPVAAGSVMTAGGLAVAVGLELRRLPGGGQGGVAAVTLGLLAIAGAIAAWRIRRAAFAGAFLAGAGAALLAYSLPRLDVLRHAVLVTDLPAWTDRLSVALALGSGAAAVVLGLSAVLAPTAGPRRGQQAPGRSTGERSARRSDQSGSQLGGYQPSGTSASASGGPQDPRS